MGGSAKLSTK
jgi:hypothetical protein